MFTDIFPDAVKIGMVSSGAHRDDCGKMQHYGRKDIVVDPVMVATSGAQLLRRTPSPRSCAAAAACRRAHAQHPGGGGALRPDHRLRRRHERRRKSHQRTLRLCRPLQGRTPAQRRRRPPYRDGAAKWFNGKRIDNPNTHGTGCTLSSAIAANLAKGYDLDTAVGRAKAYHLRRAGRNARPRRRLRPDGPHVRPEAEYRQEAQA